MINFNSPLFLLIAICRIEVADTNLKFRTIYLTDKLALFLSGKTMLTLI